VAEVAATALPSVVAIINQFEAQDDIEGGVAGGAGVIVDERGYILTNAHLVQIPGELFVLMNNGEVREATVVAHDAPFTDVAVIRVPEGGLTAINIGDSATLAPGQQVVAIGSPDIDYYNSITTGVVSAVERRKQLGNVWLEDLIQTDAAINVGNSGGPLITMDGAMVGLNTFRDVGADEPLFGVSFATSSRVFGPIAQSMIINGSFPRPYFGVEFVDLTPEVAQEMNVTETQGALVQSVTAGSPAETAGVQAGDVLTMFGEVPLSEQFGLLNALGVTQPDAGLSIEVLRDGAPLTLDVQLEPR
jgi:serine protease DegQ